MTGIIYDELFLTHGEPWHPENRQRLEAVMAHLEHTGWLPRLEAVAFTPARVEQVAWLHEQEYIESLAEISRAGGDWLTTDTYATADTYAVALLAVGGVLAAVAGALSDAPTRSLCLVRPPGHHAGAARAMGFCFLNNAALAAEAALRRGLERVAIVDFDVHHGNGTQDLFYHRRDVLYLSLHETPLYPGTGTLDEVGVEAGAGYTINVPLLQGAGDSHCAALCERLVVPALDEFRPQLLVVSAGYDTHHADPLAHLRFTAASYHALTAALVGVADRHCAGRLVVALEGGYNLVWLPPCIENTLLALEGEAPRALDDIAPELHPTQLARVDEALEHVITTHRTRLGL